MPPVISRPNFGLRLMRSFGHPGLLAGMVVLALMIGVAITAPLISPHSPLKTDLINTLAPPSWDHPFGTDDLGRDVLSRVIYGTRVSLQVALWCTILSLVIGVATGALAGFYGGWTERTTVSMIDILLAFPGLLLALALVAARGSSLNSVIIAISLAYAPRVAAVMRAVVLTIAPRTFVEASRAIGMPDWKILFFHVVPNALPPVIIVATVGAATAILGEAGLSFLGLGVQPPTPTWGNVIAGGQGYLQSNPWISLSAGLAIAVTVVAFNLLGDGLRDSLDPQLRQNGARMM